MFSLRSLIAILNRPLAEVQAPVPVYQAAGDRSGAGSDSVIPYLRESRALQAAAAELPMEAMAASQPEQSL